jgi:hypothetical protein
VHRREDFLAGIARRRTPISDFSTRVRVFMNISFSWFGALAVVASVASAPFHDNQADRLRAVAGSPCVADSNFQRLAFWVGDWDVFDSVGTPYATQHVRAVVDACAITAEWTGGVGDQGMSLSAFDRRSGQWKQMYVSNQVPSPLGVLIRNSDPSYHGPGIRFIPLADPATAGLSRTRVTIVPLSEHRVLQQFEDSRDGGETWITVFKAEHRLQRGSEQQRGKNELHPFEPVRKFTQYAVHHFS